MSEILELKEETDKKSSDPILSLPKKKRKGNPAYLKMIKYIQDHSDQCLIIRQEEDWMLVAKRKKVTLHIKNNNNIFLPHARNEEVEFVVLCAFKFISASIKEMVPYIRGGIPVTYVTSADYGITTLLKL